MSKKNIKKDQQMIPRSSLFWLIISYVLTIIPHFLIYLPLWIAPIVAICFIWRYRIYTMKANFPSTIIKIGMLIALGAGLYFLHGNFFDSLGFSIFFMALFSFKFIESMTIRDAKVLVFLSYFAIGIGFIFNNSIQMALYSLAPFTIITMALLGLQQAGYEQYRNRFMFKEVSKILLLSFPFMIVLFIFFPRFPSMLSLNKEEMSHQSAMGITDTMNPGDISSLVENDELIFWAEFKEDVMPKDMLYWRVLTLDQFDGKIWSRSGFLSNSNRPPQPSMNRWFKVPYAIYMEATQQKYLASLDVSESSTFNDRYEFYYDYRIENKIPLTSKIRYDLVAYPRSKMDDQQSAHGRFIRWFKRYPETSNLKTQQWISEHLAGKTVDETITYISEYIYNNEFYYTLTPQLLGANMVDDFFLGTRRGFCEHYASSVAFILRAKGIPSRVVGGYQGGITDYVNQRVQVRGSNAHAWVEYWQEEEGWKRFDPSKAIHPLRLEEEANNAMNRGDSLMKGVLLDRLGAKLVQYKEQLEYYWTKFILGYNSSTHLETLQKWFNTISVKRLMGIALGVFGGLFLLTLTLFMRPWRYFIFDIKYLYYSLLRNIENQYEINCSPATAPNELLNLVKDELPHDHYFLLKDAIDNIENYLYNPNVVEGAEKKVKQSVRAFIRKRR